MAERMPRGAVNCTHQWNDDALQPADPAAVLDWQQAGERLAAARQFWVASVRAGSGAPHVRPVFAAWVDGRLYSTSNGSKAKARNLATNPHVAVTTSTEEIDFVVEGTAAFVTDEAELERVFEAYRAKYGWPHAVRDGGFHAPFAAPEAGPPPYLPYAVTPEVVYGLGTSEALAPLSTRWHF
jgi:nitroimidazol reductase NimA-like FMN-containing flavoprotein (pyridoxamine 5'-phosphate oxidase superfamily)